MDITREILIISFSFLSVYYLYNIVGLLLAVYKGVYLPFMKAKCDTLWKGLFLDI
jgi:hypothetical protein